MKLHLLAILGFSISSAAHADCTDVITASRTVQTSDSREYNFVSGYSAVCTESGHVKSSTGSESVGLAFESAKSEFGLEYGKNKGEFEQNLSTFCSDTRSTAESYKKNIGSIAYSPEWAASAYEACLLASRSSVDFRVQPVDLESMSVSLALQKTTSDDISIHNANNVTCYKDNKRGTQIEPTIAVPKGGSLSILCVRPAETVTGGKRYRGSNVNLISSTGETFRAPFPEFMEPNSDVTAGFDAKIEAVESKVRGLMQEVTGLEGKIGDQEKRIAALESRPAVFFKENIPMSTLKSLQPGCGHNTPEVCLNAAYEYCRKMKDANSFGIVQSWDKSSALIACLR